MLHARFVTSVCSWRTSCCDLTSDQFLCHALEQESKLRLNRLIHFLVAHSQSELHPSDYSYLLASYGATLSETDQCILQVSWWAPVAELRPGRRYHIFGKILFCFDLFRKNSGKMPKRNVGNSGFAFHEKFHASSKIILDFYNFHRECDQQGIHNSVLRGNLTGHAPFTLWKVPAVNRFFVFKSTFDREVPSVNAFQILLLYESKGISSENWRPFLWGSAAFQSHRARKTMVETLYKKPSPDKILCEVYLRSLLSTSFVLALCLSSMHAS